MQLATVQVNNSKIGKCPHGLPAGACPMCNGGGGGAGGMKKADSTARAGEMSWSECAAIGAMLKAQKEARATKAQDNLTFAQNALQFQNALSHLHQRLSEMAKIIANNTPQIIAKPVAFIANTIIGGTINIIKNVASAISNFAQNISQKFTEISDKLTAVFGELKASIEKKISDAFTNLKKKIKSIFRIFEPLDIENEDKQIDETKKAFELKTFIHEMYQKLTSSKKDIEANEC